MVTGIQYNFQTYYLVSEKFSLDFWIFFLYCATKFAATSSSEHLGQGQIELKSKDIIFGLCFSAVSVMLVQYNVF